MKPMFLVTFAIIIAATCTSFDGAGRTTKSTIDTIPWRYYDSGGYPAFQGFAITNVTSGRTQDTIRCIITYVDTMTVYDPETGNRPPNVVMFDIGYAIYTINRPVKYLSKNKREIRKGVVILGSYSIK